MRTRIAVITFAALTACGPTRAPVAPGEIPEPPRISAADLEAGREVRAGLRQQFREARGAELARVEHLVDRLERSTPRDTRWWVTVFDDDRVENAAATRGNHIFVWTGLLKRVRDDAQLSAVIGHEMAHVLAGHVVPTQDEMLRRVLAQLSGVAASRVIENPAGAQIAGGLAQTTAEGFLVNPYTRPLELEADTIGLFMMADAGIDPRASIALWEEWSRAGGPSIEFFSTHPLSSARLENLERHLPEAMTRYRRARR